MDAWLFQTLLAKNSPWIRPKVDMFASPGNHQLGKFVSRYPHWEAVATDALQCPLEQFQEVYARPPWKVIGPWLCRLRDNPHLTCMMITPLWVGASWWPLLLKLQSSKIPAWVGPPYNGMFKNCLGECMQAPKWPPICTIVSGRFYKSKKCRLRSLTFFLASH